MNVLPEYLSTYQRDGLIHVNVSAEIAELQVHFMHECCAFLRVLGMTDTTPATLPADLVTAARQDRALVGRLYKASRRFPSAKQLAAHPFFVDLAGQLMQTELVSCCHFVCVRIDLPTEDRYMTPAHQDFPYIQGSMNGITVWLPFSDLTVSHGIPSFVDGSHHWGMLRVHEYSLDEIGHNGGQSFALADDPRLRDAKYVRPNTVGKNEALVFHTLLLHRSEPNRSTEARITIQLRFDDLANKDSFRRNYPEGLYLNDRLEKTYPEYVAQRKVA